MSVEPKFEEKPENRDSLSVVTVPARTGSVRCLWAFTKTKRLILLAKVKDGFVPRIRDEIFPVLKTLRVVHCPFTNLPEKKTSRWGESLTAEKMEQCRWVKPKLVCEVAFLEWTDAGHLRHCTFVAMRDDKKAAEVVAKPMIAASIRVGCARLNIWHQIVKQRGLFCLRSCSLARSCRK
jgi:hypothetical protein